LRVSFSVFLDFLLFECRMQNGRIIRDALQSHSAHSLIAPCLTCSSGPRRLLPGPVAFRARAASLPVGRAPFASNHADFVFLFFSSFIFLLVLLGAPLCALRACLPLDRHLR
jgi:hypothetical protein